MTLGWKPLEYEPLGHQQIRLLRLSPGAVDDPLIAVLEHHDLQAVPDYDALSYTWGTGSMSDKVCFQDGSGPSGSFINVWGSLSGALRAIRRTSATPTLVWVDYICVNQADLVERSSQVQLMGQIYRRAETVIVWLGEDAGPATKNGIRAIQYFVDPSRVETEAPWYDNPERSIAGFVDIFRRLWWYRVWTVQEAVLARRVKLLCGTSETTWTTDMQTLQRIKFRIKTAVISPQWQKEIFPRWRAARIAAPLEADPSRTDPTRLMLSFENIELGPLLEVIELQIRERADEGGFHLRRDLLDLVYDLRHRQAADPRDQIFAMLGLAEGRTTDLGGFRPDYTDSVEEVHEKIMKAIRILHPLEAWLP